MQHWVYTVALYPGFRTKRKVWVLFSSCGKLGYKAMYPVHGHCSKLIHSYMYIRLHHMAKSPSKAWDKANEDLVSSYVTLERFMSTVTARKHVATMTVAITTGLEMLHVCMLIWSVETVYYSLTLTAFINTDEIKKFFLQFGSLTVDWPHKAQSKSPIPPKGKSVCCVCIARKSVYLLHNYVPVKFGYPHSLNL